MAPVSAETSPPPAAADTKDWTWVLERRCPECGYDAAALAVGAIGDLLDHTRDRWREVLAETGVRRRPGPTTWSPLEYAAHVRDVHRVFDERLALILAEEDPAFRNWDQDAAAGGYHAEHPADVAVELAAASDAVAARYRALRPEHHGRRGLRDNGSAFTIASLGRYHLHDVVHHLHDVGHPVDPPWTTP